MFGGFRLCITSVLFLIGSILVGEDRAFAQLAPTGSHYAGRASDTGFSPVSGTGAYGASVPLAFPPARGDLPLPIAVTYGRRGVGAAGLGWDLPLSYVQIDRTVTRRRPTYGPNTPIQGREQLVVSIAGRLTNMVKVAQAGQTVWLGQGNPDLELRNEAVNLWVLRDGQGQEFRFTQVVDSDFWLLTSIASAKSSNRVELVYEVTLPSFTGGSGVSIDLVSVRYNTHPSTAGCTKTELRFGYGAASPTPLSLSFVKYLAYVRMRTLATVDVMQRESCGAAPQRVHRYAFEYAADPDTRLPQLAAVQMLGRSGTAEETVRMPITRYGYGSATSSQVLRYQRGVDVPLPSDIPANAPIGRTFQDTQASSPDGGKTYVNWQNLLDVTGDGRPDLVFQSGSQLMVAANRPGGGTSTTLSPSVPLSSSVYTGRPLASHSTSVLRYAKSFQNVANVWRQTIDVNGDGRVDIVDASEQPGFWTFYLNTPGTPVTWVKRTVRVTELRQMLQARGHVITGDRVPLARRTTGFDTKMTECWKWDGVAGQYVSASPTSPGCLTLEPIVDQQAASSEMTFTEWELRDVNGDGYPDVVFNSSPIRTDYDSPPDGGVNGNPPVLPNAVVTRRLGPADGDQNNVLITLNTAGVRLDQAVNPFSLAVTAIENSKCGVGRWMQATEVLSDEQSQLCAFDDVNGDGVVDRIDDRTVRLGTGIESGLYISNVTVQIPGRVRQFNPHDRSCNSQSPSTSYGARQLSGLRDLTGDGIPDFIEQVQGTWSVAVGTGVGFVASVPIDVPDGFALSSTTETCSSDGLSLTTGGLYDLDGDGKPEVVTMFGPQNRLAVSHLQGTTPGNPQAGRLSTIDNGHGAITTITYRSAKEDGTTPHQVPFPEVVVTSVETTGVHGLGGTLSAVGYAYGDARMFFDPALDAFTMRAYGRAVEVHGTGSREGLAELAIIRETYPLSTFDPASTDAQRFDRYLKAGRIRDVHVLGRDGVPRDPWALVSFDSSALDGRRMSQQHYEWSSRYVAGVAPANTIDCVDIAEPYDWALSFGYDIGHAFAPCATRGLGYVSEQTAWTGKQPGLGDYAQTRSRVLAVDDLGRILESRNDNDTFQSNDDTCVELEYAAPTTSVRMFSALARRKVTDCGKPTARTLSVDTWEYDALPLRSASLGRLSSHTVERYGTATGLLLGSVREYEIGYDAVGNSNFVASAREDGAIRSMTISHDAFGLVPIATTLQGTGITSLVTSIERDPVTLEARAQVDENGTKWGQEVDGFGRQLRATVTPPGGTPGVVSTAEYLGFVDNAPSGRTIATTTYADPVPPANLSGAEKHVSYSLLDELGRTRRVERKLGADYGDQLVMSRQYDGRGRVSFETDPYPTTQNATTAYGTSYHYDSEGMLKCSVRGNGPQPLVTSSDASLERFPTCFTRTFVGHNIQLSVQRPDSLSTGAQNGVVYTDVTTAIGRLLWRETRNAQGTRLELSTHTSDRLGQPIGLTRYNNPSNSTEPVMWTWSRDSVGQMLSATEPGVDTRSYNYSKWGELLSVSWTDSTTSTAKRLEYAYDALGRRTSSAERESGAVVPDTTYAWFYDQAQDPSVLASTFAAGRLTATKSSIGNMHLSYDAFGRVDQRAFVGEDAQLYRELTTRRFDGALSLLEFRLPDTGYTAEQYRYDYDSASRLRAVTFAEGQASKSLYAADTLDAFGRVRHAIFGENITYDSVHDDTGRRLPRQETVTLASGQVRGTTHLLYDAIGRELKREDRDGAANPLTTSSYDALGRLRSSIGGSPAFRITADYDPLGNRVRQTDQVGPSQVSITPDTLDRDRICRIDYGGTPSGCNVTHDGSGNVVRQLARDGNTRALTYFPSGAVRTITTAPSRRSAVFRYDASGEISTLDVKGPTDSRNDSRYGLIQRRNAVVNGVSQSILVRQIPGVGASRRGANGPFVFPFGEDRGTRFAATNDSSTFVQDVSYRPFGESTSTPSASSSLFYTREQWNGGDLLADLGVVSLGARIYDPIIGRFLSRDPLIIPRTASSTNPYAFALNDPINHSDPSGLDPGLGICATSSGAPCGGTGGASLGVGVALGIGIGLASGWGGSGGSAGPAGPSLLSKDAFDTAPISMWPQWQPRDFLDGFAGTVGVASFDQYVSVVTDVLGGAETEADSYNPGLFPIAGTASLFLNGTLQTIRGVKAERDAARRGDIAGMYAASGDQAIGVLKSLAAVASVAGPAAEVGSLVRAGSTVAGPVTNPIAGSIRQVNAIGGTQNCVACAIATDATLRGRPASAMPGGPFNVVESITRYKPGSVGIPANGAAGIRTIMNGWGPGSRGIVWGTRGAERGHTFNVVNQAGSIRFLDGQTGRAAIETGYDGYFLFRTQ